ncbi:MAG: DUF2752 domain-containing protein [Deltaproteobacteria bacterium]
MIARAGPPSVHALGLAAVSVALLAAAALLPLDAPPLSLFACPLRAATGVPCLSCGCAHAFHFAVRGRFGAALASSPAGALLAAACAVHAGWTALRLCGLAYAPRLEMTSRLRWSAALALVANWAFVALWGAR